MSNLVQRTTAYPPSVKATNVYGHPGLELFVTLRTRNCIKAETRGSCTFCGLGNLDGKRPPLGIMEAQLQTEGLIRKLKKSSTGLQDFIRISLISMSDSLLHPRIIQMEAMKRVLEVIAREFPNVRLISVESRTDGLIPESLKELGAHIDSLFGDSVLKEIACGIETPYPEVRKRTKKFVSDQDLAVAADSIARTGWHEMRGYFIYNLFEHDSSARIQALKEAVDLMNALRGSIRTSVLVHRAYVPAKLAGTELFREFTEIGDSDAIPELREAAKYAKMKPIQFEIDSTCEDQAASSATFCMGREYREALDRYNRTLDPNELVLTRS